MVWAVVQQPVATDLRMVLAAMRISTTLERMGDLAQHVAKTARMRYPDSAVPSNVASQFREMAEVADRMGAKMAEVLGSKDLELAREGLDLGEVPLLGVAQSLDACQRGDPSAQLGRLELAGRCA